MLCEVYIISAVMEMEIAMICLISENRVLSVIYIPWKFVDLKTLQVYSVAPQYLLIFSVLYDQLAGILP